MFVILSALATHHKASVLYIYIQIGIEYIDLSQLSVNAQTACLPLMTGGSLIRINVVGYVTRGGIYFLPVYLFSSHLVRRGFWERHSSRDLTHNDSMNINTSPVLLGLSAVDLLSFIPLRTQGQKWALSLSSLPHFSFFVESQSISIVPAVGGHFL